MEIDGFGFDSWDVCPECGKPVVVKVRGSYEIWECNCGYRDERIKV